ncbi:hypothetical protein BX666DRAFT_798686 [Dichotomocladium elegans]|nr:hypothetical protein BX666DRAFT_798686 [Dichotomocladium elegans]
MSLPVLLASAAICVCACARVCVQMRNGWRRGVGDRCARVPLMSMSKALEKTDSVVCNRNACHRTPQMNTVSFDQCFFLLLLLLAVRVEKQVYKAHAMSLYRLCLPLELSKGGEITISETQNL